MAAIRLMWTYNELMKCKTKITYKITLWYLNILAAAFSFFKAHPLLSRKFANFLASNFYRCRYSCPLPTYVVVYCLLLWSHNMMTCVHVLIRLFDCLEGGNTSSFKAAKGIERLSDILFFLCLAFVLCNTRYLFRPIPNPFEPRDILFIPRPLYINALSNIVSLPSRRACF